MEEKELNEIIVVEQLPKITQQLQIISDEVDKEIEYALSLEVNDDTVKEVKQVRAKLNKINSTLEEKRKYVKKAILTPYEQFLDVYDNLVKNKLNEADNTLKMRINTIEEEQKKLKEDELREFANQHIEANNLQDIITFEDINLNITLSVSIKSLKEQALDFINKVANDVKLISLEEYSDEILLEYKKCRGNYAQCKLNVIERHKQLEELKTRQLTQEEIDKANKIVEKKVEEVITPPKEVIENDEVITVTFTITDTKEKILKLRDFLKENDIKYE